MRINGHAQTQSLVCSANPDNAFGYAAGTSDGYQRLDDLRQALAPAAAAAKALGDCAI